MIRENVSRAIKFWTTIGVIIVVLVIAGIIILKYNMEGETRLPYKLTKISIISTAEGIEDTSDETDENAWNLNVIQINDLYISIDRTEFAKEELLTGLRIENIEIVKSPMRGHVKPYMPNSLDGRVYNYINDYLVQDKLQYTGAAKSNSKTLEIGNKGGLALISFANTDLGNFTSTEGNAEIKHDGTLLSKINSTEPLKEEELKFSVKFDLIIQIDNNSYKGTVQTDLPCGDLMEKGTAILEVTDFSNVVFKKI